jgi:hypothetical protein
MEKNGIIAAYSVIRGLLTSSNARCWTVLIDLLMIQSLTKYRDLRSAQ